MTLVTLPHRRPQDTAGDADVLRRIRDGDRSAVDDLYERFRRPAFALARRILGDDTLAEDVLQEVFLSVWRDPGAFDRGRGSVASWLLAVVHHKAVDAVRREESQRRRLDARRGRGGVDPGGGRPGTDGVGRAVRRPA
jgi:DNA-directed RNA polymerase specialized sigma24 family protein